MEGSGAPRKRRTRGHIIADLAVNHVERQALLAGFSVERAWHDYGTDLKVYTHHSRGEFKSGLLPVQVKGTDSLRIVGDGGTLTIRVESAHLRQRLYAESFREIALLKNRRIGIGEWTGSGESK